MKTFKEFKSIIEGKYSDEDAFRKNWNHFVVHPKYGKTVKSHLDAGKTDSAKREIERELQKAKTDPKHPLSFEKARKGFTKGKSPADKKSYEDEMQNAPDSVIAWSQGRRGKSHQQRGLPVRVTGGEKADTTGEWRSTISKKVDTAKRDIEGYDPKNPKYGIGVSLKMGKGSQTMSGGTGETSATWKAAAKETEKNMKKSGASSSEISTFKSDTNRMVSKLARAQQLGKSNPNFASRSNISDRRSALMQKMMDKYMSKYPQTASQFDKEAAGGRHKFGKSVSAGKGGAQEVVTGSHKDKLANVQDIQHRGRMTPKSKPASRAPKSSTRDAAVTLRVKPTP